MRLAWTAVVALIAAWAGAAFAQAASEDDPPVLFRSGPGENEVSRIYPREAWSARQEGRAILCCLVTEDDGLACAAVAESPQGYGFGEAARIIASRFRLTPESAAQWRERNGAIRLPMAFRVPRQPIAAPPIEQEPQCGVRANVGG
jgi:TonB family protein